MRTQEILVSDDQCTSASGSEIVATKATALRASDSIAAEISALSGLRITELRSAWIQRFRCSAPSIQSTDVMRRLFAWRLQAEAYGGLTPAMMVKLDQTRSAIARGNSAISSQVAGLHSGAVLVREWRGVEHRVEVVDDGFLHQGQQYTSLSEVARAITGTRWSGPRFFGLDQRNDRAPISVAEGTSS